MGNQGKPENMTMAGSFKTGEVDPAEAGRKSGESKRAKKSVTDRLRILMDAYYDAVNSKGEKTQEQGWDLAATVLFAKAVKEKNLQALTELIDRLEGKSKQFVQVSGSEELFESPEMKKIREEMDIPAEPEAEPGPEDE